MRNKNQKTNELNCKKHIANIVGADASVCPKNHRGITLIALVITIIVMLILVGVTVSIAINGGLFGMAKEAKTQTEKARDVEQELANGRILVGDTWYDSMSDYVNGNRSEDQSEGGTYFTAEKEDGYLTGNATYESGGYTATIPKGFKVSEVAGEDKIETGLVIKDKNGNEFVWIPITEDLKNSYSYDSTSNEPANLTSTDTLSKMPYDSQEILNYYYDDNYYTYDENAYTNEYTEMVRQVNKYDGFYIGRYETTIDEDGIGSKYNKPVLTANKTIKDGKNERSNQPYTYRWYGLYYEQKNTKSVMGNQTDVQTAMIYGQLWEKTMEFIKKQNKAGKTNYNVDNYTTDWHNKSQAENSGQLNPGKNGDIALNIWDLESNCSEWSQEALSNKSYRHVRGGHFQARVSASSRVTWEGVLRAPAHYDKFITSRLIMYIKDETK